MQTGVLAPIGSALAFVRTDSSTGTASPVGPIESSTMIVWVAKALGQEAAGLVGFGKHLNVGLQ